MQWIYENKQLPNAPNKQDFLRISNLPSARCPASNQCTDAPSPQKVVLWEDMSLLAPGLWAPAGNELFVR